MDKVKNRTKRFWSTDFWTDKEKEELRELKKEKGKKKVELNRIAKFMVTDELDQLFSGHEVPEPY